MTSNCIVIVGAGRMGRGIAQSYALAGVNTLLVDLKQRSKQGFETLAAAVDKEVRGDLEFTADLGFLQPHEVQSTLDRISIVPGSAEDSRFKAAEIVYEALPEILELKRQALEWINLNISNEAIVASTTSTLNVDELAKLVNLPGRFLNAHWLNPAHLMPVVEVAVGSQSEESAYKKVHASLTQVGKVPVRCTASAGYIVPRIQALAMNEAARLVEEGVASAEDVDTAVRAGFGLRFAVLGLLEFIDWGGNDILYHASKHLSRTVDKNRYGTPEIIEKNMQAGRNGIREGRGFYNYQDMDVDAYRRDRLTRFLELVEYMNLLPTGLGRHR